MNTNDYNTGYGQTTSSTPNIFKQFIYSFVPPKYNELAQAKVISMILLILIVIIMASVILYGKHILSYTINDGLSDIIDSAPDFQVSGGEFSIAEDVYIEDDDLVFYLTDEIDEFDYYDVEQYLDGGFNQIMLVSRYNLCIYTLDDGYQELALRDLGTVSFTKADIVKWGDIVIYGVLLIADAFSLVGNLLWYFPAAGIYLLVGMLLALIFGKKISAGHLFKAAVFAKLPFFIIATAFKFVGFDYGILGFLRIVLTLTFFGFCIWFLPEKKEKTLYQQY